MEYKLTEHVKERYVERIMGRTDKTEVRTFITQHEDKIRDDIEKMIEYGEVIYDGPQVRTKNPQPTTYILRDNWLVVINSQNNNVVTLYKIDLGIDDEFNKLYISSIKEKLQKAKVKVAEEVEILKGIEESYNQAIQDNEAMIQEYKTKIKSLEVQNESLRTLLQEEKTNISIAEEEIRDIVAIMTTGTKF